MAKPPYLRFYVLCRLKKLIRVAFSSSNIVEIWAHWMCMAAERKYEFHLYPIRGRRHRDSTSVGQVKHFYHYALSFIMFLDLYCIVLSMKTQFMIWFNFFHCRFVLFLIIQIVERGSEEWGSPMSVVFSILNCNITYINHPQIFGIEL